DTPPPLAAQHKQRSKHKYPPPPTTAPSQIPAPSPQLHQSHKASKMDPCHRAAPSDEHNRYNTTPTSSATQLPDPSLAGKTNMADLRWSPFGSLHEGEMQQFGATPFTSPFDISYQDDMNTAGNWNFQQPHALGELHVPGLGHDGFASVG
ncbi:hypothetical protein K432DRAFT_471160, partial [Lepidopterella palustris CBS 459.81]